MTRIGSRTARGGVGGSQVTARDRAGDVGAQPPGSPGGGAARQEPRLGADHEQIGAEFAGDGNDRLARVAGEQDGARVRAVRPGGPSGVQQHRVAEGVVELLSDGEGWRQPPDPVSEGRENVKDRQLGVECVREVGRDYGGSA